jgi:predicted small lipoprotein YifL
MHLRAALIVLMASLVLAGCGRRGGLETPPRAEAAAVPTGAADIAPTAGEAAITPDGESPGSTEPKAARPAAAPDRPFLLDALI